MAKYQAHSKVGLLGGGQLARMLAQSAASLGLEPHVYSESPEDPAAQVTAFHHCGSLKDPVKVTEFLQSVDVATFESEFLDTEMLKTAQKLAKTKILPAPKVMGTIQDRFTQKRSLDRWKIPTAPWVAVTSRKVAEDFLKLHDYPVVFKKRLFGYDGYGTFIIKNKSQLANFMGKHFQDGQFIVEKFIPFDKEMAVIIARSRDGSMSHFPLVESKQKEARCFWIKGPMKHSAFNSMLKKLFQFLEDNNYVGVMGVEFFAKGKQLTVNEMAPRVHNTGHYTLDTEGPSQFDLHWMCLLGENLPKTLTHSKGFAMVNLLGGTKKQARLKAIPGLHWYGKKEIRKGRKMGHLNATASNPNLALKTALKNIEGISL